VKAKKKRKRINPESMGVHEKEKKRWAVRTFLDWNLRSGSQKLKTPFIDFKRSFFFRAFPFFI